MPLYMFHYTYIEGWHCYQCTVIAENRDHADRLFIAYFEEWPEGLSCKELTDCELCSGRPGVIGSDSRDDLLDHYVNMKPTE